MLTPLAIIITDHKRVTAALRLAAAAAALSRRVALLFDAAAVTALAHSTTPPLLAELIALGIPVTACQTGLADTGLHAGDLACGIQTGGMVGFLAENADAQIILA